MTNLASVEDISLLIPYYDDSRKPIDKYEVGQIVFAPVSFTDRRPHIYDVKRSDPTSHTHVRHQFRPLDDKQDFRKKPDRLPIAGLALGETEELLAIRAKMRPCLILGMVAGVNPKSLPEGVQRQKALNGFDTSYLLVPLYSVSTGHKETQFGPIMTARIKCMMYPEFIYAPQNAPALEVPGVIRLDRAFWTHLIACSEPTPIYLSNEMMGICWTQIKIILGDQPSEDYSELRDLLLSELPAEYK